MAKIFFVCDPEKNTECPKTNCHLLGGPCKAVANAKFAKEPIETVTMVIPMDAQDIEALLGGKYEQQPEV